MVAAHQRPSLLFVHGAWHSSSTWTGLRSALGEKGYETFAVDLLSTGLRENAPVDHLEDVEAVRRVLERLIRSEARQVLLVAHSYGGVPSSLSIQDLESGVVGIVFIDALMPSVGKSAYTLIAEGGGGIPAEWRRQTNAFYSEVIRPREAFYNDVDASEAEPWISDLRPQANAAMAGVVRYVAWKHVPCMFVDCTQSVALSAAVKVTMLAGVRNEAAYPVVIKKLDSGHTPMIRYQVQLVEFIEEACEMKRA